MYGSCLNCGEDIGNQMDWDTLGKIITCPKCHNEMTVNYDESWDGYEENSWWWVENIEENERNIN